MKNFFSNLGEKMNAWAQGRYGSDDFNRFLTIAALVCIVLSFFIDFFSWIAAFLLIYLLFRTLSRNFDARRRENETYLRVSRRPKQDAGLAKRSWQDRKTTLYFRCKGCGQVLSVPRGKGTLRVVCPKCKTEVTKKS